MSKKQKNDKPAEVIEFVPETICPFIQAPCIEQRCVMFGIVGHKRMETKLEPVHGCKIVAAMKPGAML